MKIEAVQEKYIPKAYSFYRNNYHRILILLMFLIILMAVAVGFVLYQMANRPEPIFNAIKKTDDSQRQLTAFNEPNLLSDTLLRFASKAATVSYTFDFYNYETQIAAARPYFTAAGWQDYLNSVNNLISTIVKNQLVVNGVVSGVPVIANQGPLPGKGYTWRIQIPFLVTYQSANITTKRNFYVTIILVRVPTTANPQGVGIDQFIMS